jgi:hypothetical protein
VQRAKGMAKAPNHIPTFGHPSREGLGAVIVRLPYFAPGSIRKMTCNRSVSVSWSKMYLSPGPPLSARVE